jgi:hypothetical protein
VRGVVGSAREKASGGCGTIERRDPETSLIRPYRG